MPVGPPASAPAGGQRAPWSVQVTFQNRTGTVLTVAAATGGHLAAVERFAVTGVWVGRTGPPSAATNDVDGDGRQDAVSLPDSGMLRIRNATGATDTVTFDADGRRKPDTPHRCRPGRPRGGLRTRQLSRYVAVPLK